MANQPAQDEAAQEAEVVAAPRRSMKGSIMIAAGLIAGIGAGTFGVGPAMAGRAPDSAADSTAEAESADHGGGHGKEGAGPRAPHLLENLVLNPAGTKGTRFLLFSVGIEASDATTPESLSLRDAEMRDRVIRVLGAKSLDELVDVAQRDRFRSEITAALDSLFGKHAVRAVYFPQFVVQ